MAKNTLSYRNLNPIIQSFCKLIYKLNTWKIEDTLPNDLKMIVILAPHTTNWDFLIMLTAAYSLRIKPQWLGKHTMFKGPLGWFYKILGGIPIDRTKKSNAVEQIVKVINERDQIVIGIAPEGTRSKTKYWKSGFYHIALMAKVPIHFAYIDFPSKTAGVTGGFMPSGDIDADLKIIQNFFADKRGKFPEKTGEIQFKPKIS